MSSKRPLRPATRRPTARSQSATGIHLAIKTLVRRMGSPGKLIAALTKKNPRLRTLKADMVDEWLSGKRAPSRAVAGAINALTSSSGQVGPSKRAKPSSKRPRKRADDPAFEKSGVCVYGLSWLGLRVTNVNMMCDFYENALGMHRIHKCDRDHAILQTDNGDYVALYGPTTDRYGLFTTGPVIGFRVPNIVAARAALGAYPVKFIDEIHVRDNGKWKYSHFEGPDGCVYELVEESPFIDSLP